MHISLTYHHLTHHIVPGPQSVSYFIPFVLLPAALLIPRTILSKWQNCSVFLPAIVVAIIHAWEVMGCVDVISVNALLWSFYFLLLRDPWLDFRRVVTKAGSECLEEAEIAGERICNGDLVGSKRHARGTIPETNRHDPLARPKHNQMEDEPYPRTLSKRLPWVLRLLGAIRLNDWKINIPSHDSHQPPPPTFRTRTAFFVQAILSFMRGYLILDLTSAYTHHDTYFQDTFVPMTSSLPPPFTQFPPQLFRNMIIALQAWSLISQMFYLPCLLPVSLNSLGLLSSEWSPHTWAPYFGRLRSVFLHGVRGFWGRYWHQTMRHSCSGPGYALADLFQLSHHGILRYTLINFVAFGLSGLVHTGLVPPEPLHATVSATRIRLYVGAFFWVQPIGMLTELLFLRFLDVIGVAKSRKRDKGSIVRLFVNALWVVSWFSLCLPLLGEAARQLRYWRVWLVPLSLWKLVKGEEYVMWYFLKT